MEITSNSLHSGTAVPAGDARHERAASRSHRRSGRSGDDVVRWREFRLALWIGGFALAAILGGQGFLYAAIMGLQGEIAGIRVEMHTQVGGLRADVQTQINELREDMQTQINELRADMQAQFTDLRERVHELSERVARIETRLDMDTGTAVDPDG